jgi:trimethylamine--corrinoid protein Co-methyltransferase
MRHYATANFEPLISDAGPFETWSENGSLTADQRATARWHQMLNDYQQPEMQSDIHAALEDFVSERKAQMFDEWY